MTRRVFDRDQLVLRVPHLLLSHAGQLTETVAGGHAFHEVLVALMIEHEVNGRLIDREEVGGGNDADIRDRRLSGRDARAVAVNRHAAKDVDEGDVFPEVVERRLRGIHHQFHEGFLHGPVGPAFGDLVDDAMHLALADAARGEADRDILHRAAEAAHRVTLEVGENDEGVVIHDVTAHRHVVEMEAVTDREVNAAFLVENINRAEIPAIHLQRFAVTFCRIAVTFVEGVRLNDVAVRNAALEVTHEVARKNIGAVLFARVELDRGAAVDAFIHAAIKLKEMLGVDHRGKEHFRAGARDIKTRDILRPDHRSLRIGCCHLKISNETEAIPVFSAILVFRVQRHFLIINFRRRTPARRLSFSQKLAGNIKILFTNEPVRIEVSQDLRLSSEAITPQRP